MSLNNGEVGKVSQNEKERLEAVSQSQVSPPTTSLPIGLRTC